MIWDILFVFYTNIPSHHKGHPNLSILGCFPFLLITTPPKPPPTTSLPDKGISWGFPRSLPTSILVWRNFLSVPHFYQSTGILVSFTLTHHTKGIPLTFTPLPSHNGDSPIAYALYCYNCILGNSLSYSNYHHFTWEFPSPLPTFIEHKESLVSNLFECYVIIHLRCFFTALPGDKTRLIIPGITKVKSGRTLM